MLHARVVVFPYCINCIMCYLCKSAVRGLNIEKLKGMRGIDYSRRSVLHIYQRSRKGYLLFYTVTDYLVFFTLFCVLVRKHRLRVLGVCPMFDHIHILVDGADRNRVSAFMRELLSLYAKELNNRLGLAGPVFCRRFGCAVKTGHKAICTACSYLYNNPGEKQLCIRAEQYRWTFLAYAESLYPFSDPVKLSAASFPQRKAIKAVNYYLKRNRHLAHAALDGMFGKLKPAERQQLTDYIITKYNCIDYQALFSFYDNSYSRACLAFASNQGSEYDLKEERTKDTHRAYQAIPAVLKQHFDDSSVRDILKLDIPARQEILPLLLYETHASIRQLVKYLRL